jgi:DNA-binding transcriptional MerR regulator
MRLGELSGATGATPASIKFYLREGLLQPGESINPTRASYGEDHARRLRLIQGLRTVVGLGLGDIRRIIDAAEGADASPGQRLALLRTVQSVVLGLDGADAPESDDGRALIHAMGWPDEPSEARSAVDRQLDLMRELGVGAEGDVLEAYGRAADAIASVQLEVTDGRETVEEVILTAAVGIHMHNQLILKVIALAQASRSIRRYLTG